MFVSRRRLDGRKKLPRATARWALDSGGFSELSLFGKWTLSNAEYALRVQRYERDIGKLDWAAPCDWMCEPEIVAKTGLSVEEHQLRTIVSVQECRALGCAVIPVIQGYTLAEYLAHVEDYDTAGINLVHEPIVGVGSICRRHDTDEAALILNTLASFGINIHAFGLKSQGLMNVHRSIVSADSMAWSFAARRAPPLDTCIHMNCANCYDYAWDWYWAQCEKMVQS
jgi:hypothetical protein